MIAMIPHRRYGFSEMGFPRLELCDKISIDITKDGIISSK